MSDLEGIQDSETVEESPPLLQPPPPVAMAPSSYLYQHLSTGFRWVRKRREAGSSTTADTLLEDIVSTSSSSSNNSILPNNGKRASPSLFHTNATVIVNFMDPTSASSTSSSSTGSTSSNPTTETMLYMKLVEIFQRDYGSKLRQVQYQHFRSNVVGTIETLAIQPVLTTTTTTTNSKSSLTTAAVGDDSVDGSSGGGGTADPAEWHVGPYCHVYLAACESMEHYRNKVKPSVQAFVHQIETARNNSSNSQSNQLSSGASVSSTSTGSQTNRDVGGSTNAAAAAAAANTDANNISGGSGHFLIVYVPTGSRRGDAQDHRGGDSSADAMSSSSQTQKEPQKEQQQQQQQPRSRVGAVLASRMAMARQRMQGTRDSIVAAAAGGDAASVSTVATTGAASTTATSSNTDSTNNNNSAHADGEVDGVEQGGTYFSTTTATATSSATGVSTTAYLSLMSKQEKELFKRVKVDFPMGSVCVLSTLAMDYIPSTSEEKQRAAAATKDGEESGNRSTNGISNNTLPFNANLAQVEKTEWQIFLKALGKTVVEGFEDRCQRYNDELRRLDQLRGGSPWGFKGTPNRRRGKAKNNNNNSSSNNASATTTKEQQPTGEFDLVQFFLVKESLAFTCEQMSLYSEALLQYNELRAFLPDMHKTFVPDDMPPDEELLSLAEAGDIVQFRRKLRRIPQFNLIMEALEQYLLTREMTLHFKVGDVVDVVRKCLSFVTSVYTYKRERLAASADYDNEVNTAQVEQWAFDFCWDVKRASECFFLITPTLNGMTDNGDKIVKSTKETLSRYICDLLDFARFRLMTLGDLLLPSGSPLRSNSNNSSSQLPKDLQTPWGPWQPPVVTDDDPFDDFGLPQHEAELKRESFLTNAFSSAENFQSRYLQLMKVMLLQNGHAGRHRAAAWLSLELVELYMQQGQTNKVMRALRSIAEVFARDQWKGRHFLFIFRLAGFERRYANPTQYLKTLVYCFNKYTTEIAPVKALDLLHSDLQSVITSGATAGHLFESPPLFRASVSLDGLRRSALASSENNLMKKLFTIGEMIRVNVALTSFLHKPIEVDTVTLSLVPFQTFVVANEDSTPLLDDDAFCSLCLKGPVTLAPGSNEYCFEWIPMASGQFVFSSLAIHWNATKFTYPAKEFCRRPIRVDILPSEATQSIEVRPVCILAGHEQPVRVVFRAGTDVIENARLQLACSPGLLLLPPGAANENANWTTCCDLTFPPCPVDGEVMVTATVTSDTDDDDDDEAADTSEAQTLHVKVISDYRCRPAEWDGTTGGQQADSHLTMTNIMEAVIPTLGTPAVTLSRVDLISYLPGQTMITALLECHTVVAFFIKGWQIELPKYLALAEDGDMNDSLRGCTIIQGETVDFGFRCLYCSDDIIFPHHATLIVQLQDEYGTEFVERLRLRLLPLSNPNLLAGRNKVPVVITPSAEEGQVGAPVDLEYDLDLTVLSGLEGSLMYKVHVENNKDWVVFGNVEGGINLAGHSSLCIRLIVIPARPGSILFYPSLSLELEKKPVPLAFSSETKVFNATTSPNHVAIAFPIKSKG